MTQEIKRKQSFLLRLPVSVREQAMHAAQNEGTSMNHFISLAVAEKLSRMDSLKEDPHHRLALHPMHRPSLRM